VFFDEIQKVGSWADQIKRLYDFSKIKIILTGSAAIALKKSSKESLSGRIYEFEMDPLSFTEYLAFKKISIDAIHEEQIKKNIEHYLMTNGFPELIEEKDAFFIKKYIKESIIDKAIYQDIPERFKISDPSMLESIINIIISNPGMVIDKNELSKRLGVFRTTISKYLFYLESSFLIKKLYNYSRNASTSEKKLKKYYTGFVSLSLGDKDDLTYFSKAVENKIILGLKAKYFWRNPQHKEIDAVLTNPLRAIESKYSNQEQKTFLLDFMEEYNLTKGIIITKNIQKTEKIKGKTIQHLPFWKWLLEEQKD
jgi:predicted AAA+ superfamily ATPase